MTLRGRPGAARRTQLLLLPSGREGMPCVLLEGATPVDGEAPGRCPAEVLLLPAGSPNEAGARSRSLFEAGFTVGAMVDRRRDLYADL